MNNANERVPLFRFKSKVKQTPGDLNSLDRLANSDVQEDF